MSTHPSVLDLERLLKLESLLPLEHTAHSINSTSALLHLRMHLREVRGGGDEVGRREQRVQARPQALALHQHGHAARTRRLCKQQVQFTVRIFRVRSHWAFLPVPALHSRRV